MLVLSRKQDESIVISNNDGSTIVITIVELQRGKVKIGVEAPKDARISRSGAPNDGNAKRG